MAVNADEQNLQVVTLHFNVPDHYLNVNEFIVAARSTEQIIDDFNRQLFDGKLKYELVVLPPEAGSLKERLGIKVTRAAFYILLGAAGSDFSLGFIEKITQKSIYELGEQAGEEVLEAKAAIEEMWSESLVAVFLAEASKTFFQAEAKELEKCGVSVERFTKAYKGRNEFYESCYRNTEIESIGFDDTENFPIQRSDFARFIVKIPEKEEEEDGIWEWEITYIKVLSPNWDRSDTRREWKARYIEDKEKKEAYFSIEDEFFWGLVDKEQLHLKGKDSIKVQWIYIKDGSKRKNIRVLRVLEYNGYELSQPLTDKELIALLSNCSKNEKNQIELFDN